MSGCRTREENAADLAHEEATGRRPLMVDDRERDTIIAALRFWQRKGAVFACAGEIEIAMNGREGDDAMLTESEIDDLVEERVNAATRTYVVAFGDAFTGLRLDGPFNDYDAALDHGERTRADDEECRVVEVRTPNRGI